MKRILLVFLLSACVDPNTQVDLMKGVGSYGPENEWRYVFPENAYRGVISDPAQLRQQHEWMIAQWLAEDRRCPSGHRITGRETASGMVVYSGVCG